MFFVHRNRTIAGLPEMSGEPKTEVERTGVIGMYALQQPRQRGLLMRDGDEVDVIRHGDA
jgi:hypothetical protein